MSNLLKKAKRSFYAMKRRCENKSCNSYKNYGGRGIKVSKKWQTFDDFLKDVGLPPSKDHSLDRIDNNKGYSKSNCRWATRKEQALNRRTNRLVKIGSEKKTIKEWSEDSRCNVSHYTIKERLNAGWSAEESVFKKKRQSRKATKYIVEINGEKLPLKEWSKKPWCKISYDGLLARVRRGKTPLEATKMEYKNDF